MNDRFQQLNPLWDQFPSMQRDLKTVRAIMVDNLTVQDTEIQTALTSMLTDGGKLLRPALTILIGRFFPHHHNDLLGLAATVELLHTATLIHDDIIDDAPVRRHQRTIQTQFGKDVAVYAGDYLFATTFKLLAYHSHSVEAGRKGAEYLEKILNGELSQRMNHFNTNITVADYTNQIAGKTAALFEFASYLGTTTVDNLDPAFSQSAQQFAYNLGMAFQILDDILDYADDQETLGKPTLEDIQNGVYSLPLILAMQEEPTIKTLLQVPVLSTNQVTEIAQLVQQSQAIETAMDMASHYTDQAEDHLDALPDGEAKDILYALSDQLLSRQR